MNSFAQLSIISSTGNTTICKGEVETYTLSNPVPGETYIWTINNPSAATINGLPNNQVAIQWNIVSPSGGFILTADPNGGGSSASLVVNVYDVPEPYITYDNKVKCQEMELAETDEGYVILDDKNGCINVCENSRVNYVVHGTLVSGSNLSKFDWLISGGLIVELNGVIITPYTTSVNGTLFLGTEQWITVHWGAVGTGLLTVTETTPYVNTPLCPPKPKTVCINIIESPVADFLYDDLTYIDPDECYEICKDQTVNFKDMSTASSSSQIEFWEWNFGDGSPVSHIENPSHTYSTPGIYDVALTVTNKCNCQGTKGGAICVNKLSAPTIFCPSVVCEDDKAKYHTDAICNPYSWTVIGGVIQGPQGQGITVEWDNVGTDGFGYLLLDGNVCDEVCPLKSKVKVPVILANGTIDGPTTTCMNTSYNFKLPAWPATNYYWEIVNNINGAVFCSQDENSHLVEVKTGGIEGSFELKCIYKNTITQPSCSGTASLLVEVKLQPDIIAPEEICINSVCHCSVTNPPSASGTTSWTVINPNGVSTTQTSVNNDIYLVSSIFSSIGPYIIQASNPANFCDPEPVLIKVVDVPPTPTNIYGEEYVCPNYSYTYTTDVVPNTITNWLVTGGNFSGSSTGNFVSVIWDTSPNKSITAYREWENLSGCISQDFSKTINHIVVGGNITGSSTVYEDGTDSYSMDLNNGLIGETYFWGITVPGGSNVGSISPGQLPNEINITWLHLGANATCIVYCKVTKCGLTETFTFPVSIEQNTQITSLVASANTVCSGEPVIFTATTIGAPASYFIWDYGNLTPPNCTAIACTTSYSNFTNSPTIYAVTVKAVCSTNGLITSTATINISVDPQPNAFLSPASNEIYCSLPYPNYSLVISNTSSGSFTYEWHFDDVGTAGGVQIQLPPTTTNYTVAPPIYPNTFPFPSSTCNGEYWGVVKNTVTGCTTKTNTKLIDKYCIGGSTSCTGVPPVGISNMNYTLTACGQVQVTCSTLGNIGVNIDSYSWSVVNAGAPFITTGVLSQTEELSPFFSFSKAGIYKIQLCVFYNNASTGGPTCPEIEYIYVDIPLVAEMKWGIICDIPNQSYKLILQDYSSVFPGNSINSWEWKVNGQQVSTAATCTTSVAAGATHNVELIVDNGTTYPCTTSTTITVPAFPVASFTATTTYDGNPSNPYKSCEEREIVFNNTSTPMNSIISHHWNFDDYTYSHMVDPIKTYEISYQQLDYYPELTVTDQYGCTSSESKQITVYDNTLNFPLNAYSPLSQEVCQGTAIQTIGYTLNNNGTMPYTWQWYIGPDLIPSSTANQLFGALPASGAYWVKITDANYCYKEINPTPAIVSMKYAPTAIIDGKQDVCYNDEIKLKAITGYPSSAPLTYTWTCTPSIGTIPSTKEISIPALGIGTYDFILSVNNTSINCPNTSKPYTVTVHTIPPKPIITLSIGDCDLYELVLNATFSVPPTPTPSFNWSNGANSQTNIIYHGGAYRCLITDQYGCKSYEDIDVPRAPNFYFWRFPIGCYSFCPEDLPKSVDGPHDINFASWFWYIDGNVLTSNQNCGWPGSGINGVVPLAINDPITNYCGAAPGNYHWGLDNGLCYQETDTMEIIIPECCEVELQLIDIVCREGVYTFTLTVDQNECLDPFYNLAVVDDLGLSVAPITILPPTPSTLNMGQTIITGSFYLPNPGMSTYYNFVIEVLCEHTCIGRVNKVILPTCVGARKPNPETPKDTDSKTNATLNIIPNPAASQTGILYSFPEDNTITKHKRTIKIMDVMGRPVKSIQLNEASGLYILDISQFAQGVYFVEINDNNTGLLTKRMLVYH